MQSQKIGTSDVNNFDLFDVQPGKCFVQVNVMSSNLINVMNEGNLNSKHVNGLKD